MKISDEIRKWCNVSDVGGFALDVLRELANRIDREMEELPRGRYGV